MLSRLEPIKTQILISKHDRRLPGRIYSVRNVGVDPFESIVDVKKSVRNLPDVRLGSMLRFLFLEIWATFWRKWQYTNFFSLNCCIPYRNYQLICKKSQNNNLRSMKVVMLWLNGVVVISSASKNED
jgi:hypothetical protein